MGYEKKRGHPEYEAYEKADRAKMLKKIKHESKLIQENPKFKKEIKSLLLQYPRLSPERRVNCIVGSSSRNLKPSVKKDLKKIEKHKKFCNTWGLDYFKFLQGKIEVKKQIRIVEKKERVCIEILSKKVTGQDVRDLIPLLMYIKDSVFGKAPIEQGRKQKTKRNISMIKEFKNRRKKGERAKTLFEEFSGRYNLSEARIKQIVYIQ